MKPHTGVWNYLCNFVNSFKDEEIITRKEIMKKFHEVPLSSIHNSWTYMHTSTIDGYLRLLKKVGVFDHIGRGKYKKLQKIPYGLKSTDARSIAADPHKWKNWFIKLEDRI